MVACAGRAASTSATAARRSLARAEGVEWGFKPPPAAGPTSGTARRSPAGARRHGRDHAQLPDLARHVRRRELGQPRRALVLARQFKDFELSVDYRDGRDQQQRRRVPALPGPATVADIDAAAIRSRSWTGRREPGHAHGRDHAGARHGDDVRRRARGDLQADARVEHADRPRRPLAPAGVVNGVLASQYDNATRNGRAGYIGLENAGNNLMYRNVARRGARRWRGRRDRPRDARVERRERAASRRSRRAWNATYTATTSAVVTSTAADATLSVSEPGFTDQRRVLAGRAAAGGAVEVGLDRADLERGGGRHVRSADQARTDALRTGSYTRTLTFTLSTTNP